MPSINLSRLPHRWTIVTAGAIAIVIATGCHRDSIDDDLAQGDAAMQATHLSEAEDAYGKAIKAAPNDARGHIALGNLYVFEHKPDLAQAEFMKVLDIDPKNAATHAALGNLYMDQNQYPLAENQYRAAIALETDKAGYHLDLAEALRKEGKLSDAEAQIRTAIGLNPRDAQAHLALAKLLESEGNRTADATSEYDQVRALDPKLFPAPAAAASPAPAEAGAPAPAGAPPAAAEGAPKVKPLHKLWQLSKNSDVYQAPDNTSAVVGHVHRKKYVQITGMAGDFFQVQLHNGTIGFVPSQAFE
jgi:tetratricopeptide (TPR) repeat protein